MLVAGDDEFGLSGERGGEHEVIVGIGSKGAGEDCRFDDLGKGAVAFDECPDRELLLGQALGKICLSG